MGVIEILRQSELKTRLKCRVLATRPRESIWKARVDGPTQGVEWSSLDCRAGLGGILARFKILLPATLLLAGIELLASGCGSSTPRLLQSISVTPANANAQSFPNGQVQFTAVGTYSRPPSQSPLTQAGWSVSDPNIATISQSGLAQCTPGASAKVTVKASTSAPCSGTGCTAALLSGTAQLSCP